MNENQQINSRSFSSLDDVFASGRRYSVVMADPPWTFATYSKKGKGKSPEQHYDCMTMDDINNLPVNDITEKDAVLFLWMTMPLINQQMETVKKWGFTYKTMGFVWVKQNKKALTPFFGMGYFTRANAELLAICTKGKPRRPKVRNVSQIIQTPIREHSRKPDHISSLIEKMYDGPYIELFARTQRENWDVMGNQTELFNGTN